MTLGGTDIGASLKPATATGVFSFFWFENIGIVLWHARPTPEATRTLTEQILAARERHPSGVSLVHIQHYVPEMLTAETRNAFARSIKELSGHIIATAVVARASGFLASALRSAVLVST